MTKYEQLLKFFTGKRILSAEEIRCAGFPTSLLTQMVERKEIQRLGRGLYAAADFTASETFDYEIIARQISNGVLCLVSALRFHNLTDENPHEISVALPHGARYPHIDYPPVKYYTRSGGAFSFGIETRHHNGTDIKVYSINKTIADCFKYRNKIGLDVAVAALREAARKNVLDYNELWVAAKICRVAKTIRPYLEVVQ